MTPSKKLPTIEGFTPGPWTAAPCQADHGETTVICGNGCAILARIPKAETRKDKAMDKANAHLIAAAPDLYRIAHEQREVIQQLVACLQQVEGCDYRAFLEAGGDAALAAAAPFLED